MKKIIIALGIAVLAGVAGWIWIHHNHAEPKQAIVVYGNVDIRQVELAFNGAERIAGMKVKEGERVKKGQLLATLDTDRLQLAVDRAAAQVAAQRQTLAALEAGSRPEDIRKARADVRAAQADADNARRNARRLRRLVKRKLASEEQADNAQATADVAQARLHAATEALNLAVAGPRKEDIAAARATLQAYRAQLALARRDLANARLYAPADGIIQNRILEPGDMASPQTPVYTLALTDSLWIRAYLPEPELGRIKPGMTARITTDSFPGKHYRGWIGYISPTAEFTPKSVETTQVRTDLVYQVRVYVCGHHDELRLGMPATVTIPTNAPQGAAPAADADPCAAQ